jgi:hypothetical protein
VAIIWLAAVALHSPLTPPLALASPSAPPPTSGAAQVRCRVGLSFRGRVGMSSMVGSGGYLPKGRSDMHCLLMPQAAARVLSLWPAAGGEEHQTQPADPCAPQWNSCSCGAALCPVVKRELLWPKGVAVHDDQTAARPSDPAAHGQGRLALPPLYAPTTATDFPRTDSVKSCVSAAHVHDSANFVL